MKQDLVIVTKDQPPMEIDDGEPKPLASIPLSQLMGNPQVCPLCGQSTPIDTREAVIDGQIFYVCKKCSNLPKSK
jgi:hypothetical protein